MAKSVKPLLYTYQTYVTHEVGLYASLIINFLILTLVYMVYFDYLVYMGGGGGQKSSQV